VIYSKPTADGSTMSIGDKVIGFSQIEGNDHDDTLASGFSQSEGVSLVEIVASIAKGFEVYETDPHAHS
jgi:hypothetical protein